MRRNTARAQSDDARGTKIGAVSLWLLLLLSEKPMYGYDILRILKTEGQNNLSTLEKLEKDDLITSRVDFKGRAADRKHYVLTGKGQEDLLKTMDYRTKMTEILENHMELGLTPARKSASCQ